MSYRQRKSWLPHCGLSASSASNIECCLMPLIALAWKLSSLATMTRQSSLPCHGCCLPLLQRVLPHAFYSVGLEAIIFGNYDTTVQLPMSWLLSPTATNRERCHMPVTVVAWKLSSSATMKGSPAFHVTATGDWLPLLQTENVALQLHWS